MNTPSNQSPVRPMRILIVEDELVVARDLKESLEGLGYQVPAIAGSSEEAIAYVTTLNLDLVLMDIMLEGSDQDGIDVAQAIYDLFNIPVVYLTAHVSPLILERVKATAPYGYLLKPFREQDLWVAIETALNRHTVEQSHHHQREDCLKQEMAKLDRLKEDFLSVISHELRTPLSNIKMATRMLAIVLAKKDVVETNVTNRTTIAKYVEILHEEIDQELRLINDILDVQRLQANTYPVNFTIVELQTLIPHLVEPFETLVARNQQQVLVHCPATLPAILTDIHILTRILSELLSNACKYTPSNEKITIRVQADTKPALSTNHWIVLDVCNSGTTIAPEEQERIFDLFYRIPQHDRWKQNGTGLGLTLAKKFVAVLKGHIEVSSSSDQVCFRILLPQITHPVQ